ncbi:MAG: NFACT RNA binding domain-containing protein [Treponema sp.]|jgi:predicted ribosome quality control (RQC) complex YloA/Tae2 family protein|nr:NFACT RNA binding domain-containing protein [Treponema sp.]
MSLNWKEIDLILEELDLVGCQIQKAVQIAFDVLCLKLHGNGRSKNLLVVLTAGACRLHETFSSVPKRDHPLRFAEFLNSRAVNGWIESAVQLQDNRIVRLTVKKADERLFLYIRLWSNAANVVVTDADGKVLDAMRRLPKRGETTGGFYHPEDAEAKPSPKDYAVRELGGQGSFNERIARFYTEQGGVLSLSALREQAKKTFEGKMNRLIASIEKLEEKAADFSNAERFRQYGDVILAHIASIHLGDVWLEADNFYTGERTTIALDPKTAPQAQAARYYERFRKAKNGLADVQAEITKSKEELARLETTLASLLAEENPLVLQKKLQSGDRPAGVSAQTARKDQKRPGLSFRKEDWLLIVGRNAKENDDLLRHYVKGGDLWLHVRDFAGSYVFIKQKKGKSYPLNILLDAGNLAVFYSKGRSNEEADLFYTPVKFLHRAKNGPKGLVIPTQEKNLHIKVDKHRLQELENCRVEK